MDPGSVHGQRELDHLICLISDHYFYNFKKEEKKKPLSYRNRGDSSRKYQPAKGKTIISGIGLFVPSVIVGPTFAVHLTWLRESKDYKFGIPYCQFCLFFGSWSRALRDLTKKGSPNDDQQRSRRKQNHLKELA